VQVMCVQEVLLLLLQQERLVSTILVVTLTNQDHVPLVTDAQVEVHTQFLVLKEHIKI